jgi:hypothetical protein
MQPFVDSARVAHIAQAICDVLASEYGSTAGSIPLAALPVPERKRMIDAATIALRTFNRSAVNVATWRAAQAIAIADYGRRLTELSIVEQQVCIARVEIALNTFAAHLRGDRTAEPRVQPLGRVQRFAARLLKFATAGGAA